MSELVKTETIPFHGDDIIAMRDEETDKVFVNVKRICESLGIDRAAQQTKLKNNPPFSGGLVRRVIPLEAGKRESLFLDTDLLPGWLCTIQVKRIKPELQDKLLRYQKEAFKAIRDHFAEGFSINEAKLEQFPDVVLDKLSQRIAEKLDFTGVDPLADLFAHCNLRYKCHSL